MMQKTWKFLFLALLISGVSACSTVMFPEVIEDDRMVDETGDKVIRESSRLNSDSENAVYEDMPDEDEVFADVVSASDKKEQKSTEESKKEVAKDMVESKKEVAKDKVIKEVKVAEVSSLKDEKLLVETKVSAPIQKLEDEKFEPSVTYRIETIYFANGCSDITNEDKAKIRQAAQVITKNKAHVKVIGYASSRTRNTDIVSHKMANFKVSSERAENVANVLRYAGVSGKDIEIEALSDSTPAYLEVMPEGERLNRRAEIYVSY